MYSNTDLGANSRRGMYCTLCKYSFLTVVYIEMLPPMQINIVTDGY